MTRWNLSLISAFLLTLFPTSARADLKDNAVDLIRKVGVHFNVSFRDPVDDPDVTKGRSYGASIGLSPGRTSGWKYPIGLTLFHQDLHSPNGEQFADLRTFAFMAGIGYGWHFGDLSTSVGIQTGYAFNKASINGDVPRAFGVPNGTVSIDADHSALVRPQVKVEYFLNSKLTLRGSADYMMLKPSIVVTTPTARLEDRWDASNVHANFGLGFYPWRK